MENINIFTNWAFWGVFFLFVAVIGGTGGLLAFKFSIRALRREFIELQYDVETITKTVKRRNARDAMQSKRDQEAVDADLLAEAQSAIAREGRPVSGGGAGQSPGANKASLRAAARSR